MNSAMFSLKFQDFTKGIATAVFAAVLSWVSQALSIPGFTFDQMDWAQVWHIALYAGLAYVMKNYFSDEQGKVLGKIG